MIYLNLSPTPLQLIQDSVIEKFGINLYIKRDDLIHPQVSGNKFRKLKYNLQKAQNQGFDTLITFGGAYSNHIYATAAAGKLLNIKTIGIIRGEELNEKSSPTLQFASECGMKLIFVSRTNYRNKPTLVEQYGQNAYYVPEGGTNLYALKGVAEMTQEIENQLVSSPNFIITPVGTGGTLAGIVSGVNSKSKVIGIVVLKNAYSLFEEIKTLLQENGNQEYENFELLWHYHCGGYAKTTPELINFIKGFEKRNNIQIEQVYTGKMLMAVYDLIAKGYFEMGQTIVVVHTGGLQGRNLVMG